jgi:hypothetical protein
MINKQTIRSFSISQSQDCHGKNKRGFYKFWSHFSILFICNVFKDEHIHLNRTFLEQHLMCHFQEEYTSQLISIQGKCYA